MTPDELHARTTVKGDGPPVIVLHGIAGPRMLEPLRKRLAKRFRLIVPTLPGFKRSDDPVEYSDESFAAFVEEVRQDAGVERVPVVGFSLGGRVALNYALVHLDRVEKLILLAPMGLHTISRAYTLPIARGLAERKQVRRLAKPATAREVLLEGVLDAESEAGRLTGEVAEMLAADPVLRSNYAHVMTRAGVQHPDWRRRLGELNIPALLLWASDDSMCPVRHARELAHLLPDARTEVLRGYGHLAVAEQPEFFADQIVPFLGGGKQQGKALPML